MRSKVKRVSPETALMRVLDALVQEAIEASDEEITGAATDLRMDLHKSESAAFAGLTYFARPQPSDFFDVEQFTSFQVSAGRIARDPSLEPKIRQRRSKRRQIPSARKAPR
jgi:hypothetical protein